MKFIDRIARGIGVNATDVSLRSENIASNISNSNLVINSNFKINQRGANNYHTIGYTIDRWYIQNADFWITPAATGVEISNGASAGDNVVPALFQKIDLDFSNYIGRNLTMTCNGLSTTNMYAIPILYFYNSEDTLISTVIGEYETYRYINSVTSEIPENTKNVIICIGYRTETGEVYSPGETMYVSSVKLELGSVATPYTPPDPVVELLRCQRYYVKYTSKYDDGSQSRLLLGAGLGNGTDVYAYINFPVSMRAIPTLGHSDYANLTIYNGVVDGSLPVTNLQVHAVNTNTNGTCNGISIAWSGTGISSATAYSPRIEPNGYISFDAEL